MLEKSQIWTWAFPRGPAVHSQASAPLGRVLDQRSEHPGPSHIASPSLNSLTYKLGLLSPALSLSQGCCEDSRRTA